MNEAERREGESVVEWWGRIQTRTNLHVEVERLRDRIAALEAENAALRAMIDGALTAAETMVATLGGGR